MSSPAPHTQACPSLPVVQGGSTLSSQASTSHPTPLALAAAEQGGAAGLMAPSEELNSTTIWQIVYIEIAWLVYMAESQIFKPDNCHLQSHAICGCMSVCLSVCLTAAVLSVIFAVIPPGT